MITAVDTNILLDILIPDSSHGETSEKTVVTALGAGPVIMSETVYTELASHFSQKEQIDRFIEDTGLRLFPSSSKALYLAGQKWHEYSRRRDKNVVCPSCGSTQTLRCTKCGYTIFSRQYVVADFAIGAHASVHADQLLTRDRGYYRTYFPELRLVQ
jgi:predicted nucleic acid-binding protein